MPAAEREARLREACWGDLSLLEEVTSLLRHHDDGPLLREGAERRLELLVAASRAALLGLLSSTRQEASGDD